MTDKIDRPPGKLELMEPHISKSINVMRGAAALGVIWGHSMYGLPYPVELNGAFWVWIFLPISGYLVGRGFLSGRYGLTLTGFSQFLLNRALRIIPLAYVALLIGLAAHLNYGGEVEHIVMQFFFIPPNNGMSLIGALWTVAAELQFYLMAIILVPLVFGIWKKSGWFSICAFFLVSILIGSYWIEHAGDVPIQPRTMIGNISFFIFGLLLACIKGIRIPAASEIKLVFVVSCVTIAWWLQNYHVEYFWGSGWHKPLGGGGIIALIIVAAVLLIKKSDDSSGFLGDGLIRYSVKGMERLGFYCYGIYVWHAVIAAINNQVWQISPGMTRLGLLLFAVLIAPISYKLIEKPMLRLKSI